jgi:hypothetical protein
VSDDDKSDDNDSTMKVEFTTQPSEQLRPLATTQHTVQSGMHTTYHSDDEKQISEQGLSLLQGREYAVIRHSAGGLPYKFTLESNRLQGGYRESEEVVIS